MKSSELLAEIKENMLNYDIEHLRDSLKREDINPISKQVSEYNIQNYEEILSKTINDEEDFEIDNGTISEIKNEIALFFDGCSPDCKDSFKRFIESICLYLSLISKKPYHPVGMNFGNDKTVKREIHENTTIYYCDVKKDLAKKDTEYYTCKYCVCRSK